MVAPTHGSLPPDRADVCYAQVADAPPAIPADGDSAHDVHAVDAGLALAAKRAASSRRQTRRGGRGRGRGRASREAQPTEDCPAPEDARPLAAQVDGRSQSTQAERRLIAAEAGFRRGLRQLDDISLHDEIRQRVLTLQAAPHKVRGTLRTALRTGLREALGTAGPAEVARGWKLFFLASRMLLRRDAGQSFIDARELERRCELFRRGEWLALLHQAPRAHPEPRGNTAEASESARAARAVRLVQLGELSAAARALTAAPLAPGTAETLAELRDPERRPPELQVPLSDAVLTHRPAVACTLPADGLLACLRGARRGSAAGPSGTTNEHLRLLLDDPDDGTLLHRAAERLANADVPEPVLAAIRVGRAVALQKPNGRVRALVVGDVFRRLVARTLAQHFAAAFQKACLPHQCGLSTRAGTEGLYKLLHTATTLDPRATVLSVDAVGAFDHVSRQAMLEGLQTRPALEPLLPFARQFYGSRSLYTWLDADGCEHDIAQGEGGEQGDPLMPALYSLAVHPALEASAAHLRDGEAVFAFLDDTYIVAPPERVAAVHATLQEALWSHARRQVGSLPKRPSTPQARWRQQSAVPVRQSGEAGGASAALARARAGRGLGRGAWTGNLALRCRVPGQCPQSPQEGACGAGSWLGARRKTAKAATRLAGPTRTGAVGAVRASCESRLRRSSCWTKASLPSGAPRTRIPCWQEGKDQAPVQIVSPPGTWR